MYKNGFLVFAYWDFNDNVGTPEGFVWFRPLETVIDSMRTGAHKAKESGTPTALVVEILLQHIAANNIESSRQFARFLARRYFNRKG